MNAHAGRREIRHPNHRFIGNPFLYFALRSRTALIFVPVPVLIRHRRMHLFLPLRICMQIKRAPSVRPSVQRSSRFISSFREERFLARPRVFPERIGRQIDAGAGVTFGSETARRSPGPRAPNLKLRAEGRSAKGWEKFVCSVAAGGKKSGGGNLSFCRRHLRKHSRTRYPPPRSAEDDGRRRRNEPT